MFAAEKGKVIDVTQQEDFVKSIKLLLENDCVADAWALTKNKENKDVIEKCIQDLLPIVSVYLTESNMKKKAALFEYCESFVFQIAEDCQPEETLLELLEISEATDICGFLICLKALAKCLRRMPRKRGTSICWVCNTIIRFICEMDLPKEIEDEKTDGCVLEENCKQARNIERIYKAIIELFEPFLEEVSSGSYEVPEAHQKEYKDVMHRFFLKLLGRPLGYMDLKGADHPGIFTYLANEILNIINIFGYEPLYYLSCVDNSCSVYDALSSTTVEAEYTNLALGIMYFLLFKYQVGMYRITHVYSLEFILEEMLVLTQDMISMRDAPVQMKATELILCVFSRISDGSLQLKHLSHNIVAKFLDVITFTMVYCDTKTVRQKCVNVYRKFIQKFTADGQYMIITSLRKTNDPGLIGFGLTILKDLIAESLDLNDPNKLKQFTGKKLIWLLRVFCVLESKADLVRLSDRIISTLNLIRYILIRDKDNTTGMGDYLSQLEETYLKPLGQRIKTCRSEHVIELDGLRKCQEEGKDHIAMKMLGCPEDMPISSQIKALDDSITIIDLIESVYSRVLSFSKSFKANIHKLA